MYAQSITDASWRSEYSFLIGIESGFDTLLAGRFRVQVFQRCETSLVVHLVEDRNSTRCFLEPRERRLVRGLRRGLSQKQLAYECNLSASTVSVVIQNVVRKLGVGCWTHLVALACILDGSAVSSRRLCTTAPNERRMEIVTGVADKARSLLSSGELDVALQVLDGYSNAQIASRRGSKGRTVANQISSAFRKVSARGRGELILRLFEDTRS